MRKPRQCPYCNYVSSNDNIARHAKVVHDTPLPARPEPTGERLLCHHCIPPQYVSKANVARHERTVHKLSGTGEKITRKETKASQVAQYSYQPLLVLLAANLPRTERHDQAAQAAHTLPPGPPASNQRDVLLRRKLGKETGTEISQERGTLLKLILRLLFAEVVHPHTRRVVAALQPSHVYGELNYSFVSRLLSDFRITEKSTFVDIGSGVGNVVLQAALECGCHALGCELVQDRHTVAESFVSEGMRWASWFASDFGDPNDLASRVELRHGDAFTDARTLATLPVADLVICNNFKFSPDLLNMQIGAVLAVIKPGAVFVSMQRIIRGKATDRRQILNELNVEERKHKGHDGDVSWMHKGLEYWVYSKR